MKASDERREEEDQGSEPKKIAHQNSSTSPKTTPHSRRHFDRPGGRGPDQRRASRAQGRSLVRKSVQEKERRILFFFGGGARRAAAAAGGEALSSKLPTTTSAFFGASHGTLSAPPARRPAFDSCLWHPAESRADSIEPCEETEEYKKARTCAPRALSSSP